MTDSRYLREVGSLLDLGSGSEELQKLILISPWLGRYGLPQLNCKRSCSLGSCTKSSVAASAGPLCLPAETNDKIQLHLCYKIATLAVGRREWAFYHLS